MSGRAPQLVILAGPNGAGKSTTAPHLLHDLLGIIEFVNADVIARGLCAFAPERAAIEAGRITLRRLHSLAVARADFAFETTLSSRGYARWLGQLTASGYEVHIHFLCLKSADAAVMRVRDRVRMGGHDIPEDTIRRRHAAGRRNFLELYQRLATTWRVYDNGGEIPRLVARGKKMVVEQIGDEQAWSLFLTGGIDGQRAL